MISKLLLCIFWAAAIAASSSLDSRGHPIVTASSSQPRLARPGIFARTVGLWERTDNGTPICDPSGTTWDDMVHKYAEPNRQSLKNNLITIFEESEMTLSGQANSTNFKFGGVATDACETWAVYPLPLAGDFPVGTGVAMDATTSVSTAYSLCGTTALAGVEPALESWTMLKVASQATVTPVPIENNSNSANNTGTAEDGHSFKLTNPLPSPVARETSVATSSIRIGPGRSQLFEM
ncbi:hypothetical protein MBLNU13_g08526t1 [Cladosporium sp. NU13]